MRPSRRGGAPTLADVARSAGVSTATVSRCLNSPERVVGETRERVMAAIGVLGYAPNFAARVLAARRTDTVGAVIPTMENAVFARGIQAFQEELDRRGATLLIASSSYREDLEARQIRTLVARGADALLLIGHHRSAEIRDFLDRRGVPSLVAWAFDPAEPRPSVGFDNRLAMEALAASVLDLGHRRIAVISAPCAANDRARGRVEGVLRAAAARGLDPAAVRVIETPYSIENGGRAFAALMSGAVPPTAVLCGNDVLAVGALLMARRMALEVPRDVSVTGFDDIELACVTDPALTTVHVPHRRMGREAARVLLAMVEGAAPGRVAPLGTSLRLRGTLAEPPADG